tara:strand:- start:5803 stop:6408 length:606 start_codon:yes stop_codon:yes gene_type:complete
MNLAEQLFDNFKPVKITCPLCNGDGYETEAKDSDSTHKVHCSLCKGNKFIYQSNGTVKHHFDMSEEAYEVKNGHLTGKVLKKEGIDRMNEKPSAELLNELMDDFLKARLEEINAPDTSLGNGENLWEFTSDDLRRRADNDIEKYRHVQPNSWGALFSRYATAGHISKTGDYTPSIRKKAHARIIPIWQINKPSVYGGTTNE